MKYDVNVKFEKFAPKKQKEKGRPFDKSKAERYKQVRREKEKDRWE